MNQNNPSQTSTRSKKTREAHTLVECRICPGFSIITSQAKPLDISPQTFFEVEVTTIDFCLGKPLSDS